MCGKGCADNKDKNDPVGRMKNGGCPQMQACGDTSGLVMHCIRFLGF